MIDLPRLLLLALASYAVTVVIADSEIMLPFRRAMRRVFALTGSTMLVRWVTLKSGRQPVICDPRDTDPEFEKIEGSDPISCRLCVGFWATLGICLFDKVIDPISILAVYGLGWFLTKQERI